MLAAALTLQPILVQAIYATQQEKTRQENSTAPFLTNNKLSGIFVRGQVISAETF